MLVRAVTFITAFLLVISSDVALGQTDAHQNCASSLDRPVYPRIARLAGMTGAISSFFEIGTSGQAENIRLQGNPLLSAEVGDALRRTEFPITCQGQTVTLNFKFLLDGEFADQPKTSVAFNSPNEYIVTSNPTGILCSLNTPTRKKFGFLGFQRLKSWWRSIHDDRDVAAGDQEFE